jgi:hypothetical protein
MRNAKNWLKLNKDKIASMNALSIWAVDIIIVMINALTVSVLNSPPPETKANINMLPILDTKHGFQSNLIDRLINKSRIREDNIDPEILMTILQIANDFATKMYKKYCPKNDPEPDPEPDLELSPEPSPKLAPVPSFEPDSVPSFDPDSEPSPKLATEPTFEPVPQPTAKPSSEPTVKPSSELTVKPDSEPSPKLASEPSFEPDPEPNPNLPHNIVIYDVGPSQHTTISVQYGLELINTLTKETTIDILLLLYFDRCARDQIQLMCEALHGKITEKKEILLRMIRARYLGNLSTDMLGGAELIKNL